MPPVPNAGFHNEPSPIHQSRATSSGGGDTNGEDDLSNPLASTKPSAFSYDATGEAHYLGTSSNWSFVRRVLTLTHERAHGDLLPADNLLFDGCAYELGWDGRRDSIDVDAISLPTPDYALFLINAVKFHCGQLFHMFDEDVFMSCFHIFQREGQGREHCSVLWYIHYLLILAFGKALIGRTAVGRKVPGVDLYVQAMKMLPDIIFLRLDALQASEILCCAALYLQCVDMRGAAYNTVRAPFLLCFPDHR